MVYNDSLRFSRTVYGVLTLIAFLLQSFWLVLATSIIMFVGVASERFNLFYRLHLFFQRKVLKRDLQPVKKDSGELSFACSMGGGLLLAAFFLLYYTQMEGVAWVLVALTSFFMFLAGFAGICTASLMYASFKKLFKR